MLKVDACPRRRRARGAGPCRRPRDLPAACRRGGANAPAPAAVGDDEQARTIAAMRPPKRARPLIAVIGANDGTETTDYLVPYGVSETLWRGRCPRLGLGARADDADAEFDGPAGGHGLGVRSSPPGRRGLRHRAGDVHPPRSCNCRLDQEPAAKGATIVGVCEGARILAKAGMLDGRRATSHWYAIDGIKAAHPSLVYARDRRYVADRGVVRRPACPRRFRSPLRWSKRSPVASAHKLWPAMSALRIGGPTITARRSGSTAPPRRPTYSIRFRLELPRFRHCDRRRRR